MVSRAGKNGAAPMSLKQLADHLGLSPATVSLVVNNAPGIRTIAMATRARVLAAAKEFHYRPNTLARSLRTRQTFTVGVIVPELSEGYVTSLIHAAEKYFLHAGYLHFVVTHQLQADLIDEYPRLLMNRSVDGMLLANTELNQMVNVPVVSISGHKKEAGVTNVLIDHSLSARPVMKHLYDLGHRRIAFMKGQMESQDAGSRWDTMMEAAAELGLVIDPELCIYLEEISWSPSLGYGPTKKLLDRTRDFTALVTFNDTSALGAIRAIVDAGLRCPDDISVIGFDDITTAPYHVPSLTTVRQPLAAMGEKAAQILIRRIQNPAEEYPESVRFEPELVVRESTGPVKWTPGDANRRAGTAVERKVRAKR